MSVDKTLGVSYLNGVLELTVLDDPEVGTTDYEMLGGVPGLEVTRATESGRLLHVGDIIGLLVLRFHEKGPGIIYSLRELSFPGRYSIPEMGVSGATLDRVFQTLYDYYVLGERESATVPELVTTQA
jgi:hypothetical protein